MGHFYLDSDSVVFIKAKEQGLDFQLESEDFLQSRVSAYYNDVGHYSLIANVLCLEIWA